MKINIKQIYEITSNSSKKKIFISISIGAIIGFLTSLIVNFLLLKLSTSTVFVNYCSFMFLGFGCILLIRVKRKIAEELIAELDNTLVYAQKYQFQKNAAILVILSSLLCLVIESPQTHHNHRSWQKSIMYICVSMSMTYTVVCFMIDQLNFLQHFYKIREFGLHVIDNQEQILALIVNCFCCGGLFGWLFSFKLDIQDQDGLEQAARFLYEEGLCLPIGFVAGMVAGFVNEILLGYDYGKYDMVLDGEDDPFDEMI